MKNKKQMLWDILDKWGPDALDPTCVRGQIEEGEPDIIVMPKIRSELTSEQWFAIPQSERILIFDFFLESLSEDIAPLHDFTAFNLNYN
jgi:hypothetical protein